MVVDGGSSTQEQTVQIETACAPLLPTPATVNNETKVDSELLERAVGKNSLASLIQGAIAVLACGYGSTCHEIRARIEEECLQDDEKQLGMMQHTLNILASHSKVSVLFFSLGLMLFFH